MSPPQDTDPAIRQHEQLLAREPNNAVAHFNLALLYKRAGRHDDAVAAYRRAIDLARNSAEIRFLEKKFAELSGTNPPVRHEGKEKEAPS